jgi:hypothetical protein
MARAGGSGDPGGSGDVSLRRCSSEGASMARAARQPCQRALTPLRAELNQVLPAIFAFLNLRDRARATQARRAAPCDTRPR